LVHAPGAQTVLIDVQSATPDVNCVLRHAHAILQMDYSGVARLRELLSRIDKPAVVSQPAVCSEATWVQPIQPPVRNKRKRRALGAVVAFMALSLSAVPSFAAGPSDPASQSVPIQAPPQHVTVEIEGVRDVLAQIRELLRTPPPQAPQVLRDMAPALVDAMAQQQVVATQMLLLQARMLEELQQIHAAQPGAK
jgi:hypothetical protein